MLVAITASTLEDKEAINITGKAKSTEEGAITIRPTETAIPPRTKKTLLVGSKGSISSDNCSKGTILPNKPILFSPEPTDLTPKLSSSANTSAT